MFPYLPHLIRPLPSVIWNVFLALVPIVLGFAIARLTTSRAPSTPRRFLIGLLTLMWLLFLPNTCYLLTEWRHYLDTVTQTSVVTAAHHERGATLALMLATGFYILYSGIGMVSFLLSLWLVEHVVRGRMAGRTTIVRFAFFLLCAVGVYLGLVNRFNSWDALSLHRLPQIAGSMIEITHRPTLMVVIVVFALFLWISYFLFDLFMLGIRTRYAVRRTQ